MSGQVPLAGLQWLRKMPMIFNLINSQATITILVFLILLSSNVYFALRKNRNDNLTYLKDQHEVDVERMNKMEDNLHEAEKKIAGFEATLIEKDKQLQMFKEIFQGRNPEMDAFIKNSTKAIEGFQQYIKEDSERMKQLLEGLKKLLKE